MRNVQGLVTETTSHDNQDSERKCSHGRIIDEYPSSTVDTNLCALLHQVPASSQTSLVPPHPTNQPLRFQSATGIPESQPVTTPLASPVSF